MKLTNRYWYKHSETEVQSSPYRIAILNPAGNFMVDGKPIARSNPSALAETSTISFATQSLEENPNNFHKCHSPGKKFSPDKYYSRLKTPKHEKEILEENEERKRRIREFKHLFHDDNYVVRPVNNLKSNGLGFALLPSKSSLDSFDHMINSKVVIER